MAAPQPVPAANAPHLDDARAVDAHQTEAEWFAGFQRHILENADYEPLRKILPGIPADYLDVNFSHKKYLWALSYIHQTRDEALHRLVINAVDDYQRHVLGVPPLPDAETSDRLACQLAEKGHVALPAISPDTVSEITAYLSAQSVYDEANPDDLLTIDEARKTLNVAYYRSHTLLACPHLVEIANDPLMLAAVQRYLGATPTLLTPAAWWSFAGPEDPKDAQLFHIDFDDLRFCKLFIYLTDVDADSGPHIFVEKTHLWPVIDDAQTRSPLNPIDFGKWYYHKLRKSDEEVSEYIGREPIELTGEAGSCFLIDTGGIHKGALPRKNDRLVCQFMYGITPGLRSKKNLMAVPSNDSGAVPRRAVETQPLAYVNRFFLRPAEVGDAQSRSAAPHEPSATEEPPAPQPVPAVNAPHLDDARLVAAHQTDVEWFAGFQRHILENADYAPLRDFFPGAPADYLDIGFSQSTHFDARMHCYQTRDEALRELIINAVDDYQRHGLGVPPLPGGETSDRLACQLAEKGHVALPAISPDTVSEITAYLSAQPVVDRGNPDDLLSIDEARKRLNVARYRRHTLLACPHLVEIANDPLMLAAVERYLGATPTLLTPSAWWSFAGPEEPKDAQLFHMDLDDYRFCKLFIYLTDVDADSGPHAYVEGTHLWPVLEDAQARSPLGPAAFGAWYFHKLRKTDEEVSEYLGRDPIEMTGEAGASFLIDTSGIHKGTLPRKNDRLVCQFMYGVTPALQIKLNPLAVPSSNSGAVPRRAVETQPFAYVNRFFLRPADVGEARCRAPHEPPAPPPDAEKPAPVVLSTLENAGDEQTQDVLLGVILGDDALKDFFKQQISQQPVGPITDLQSLLSAIGVIAKSFMGFCDPPLSTKLATVPDRLTAFKLQAQTMANLYSLSGKPNPDAVFWPNPNRQPGDQDLYKTIPYVQRHHLADKDTPIGSAGSCFAEEIARNLRSRGFNYVHTEYCDDPETGVFYAETEPGTVRFSANWGLLFNTPSFRQVAEKSFGVRALPRILVQIKPGLYADPYREAVFFPSLDSYEADYEKHLRASRQALLSSELFVVTLGLNECWEYIPDGSVISRNPRNSDLTGLLRLRTLTVRENIDNIQTFFDIVRAHNPKFKLLISVSPIPLLATGRADEYHVVTANTHSKAVLLLAAHELVERNPGGMYYFPSYETVTVCTRDPWKPDQRHVNEHGVARVMELFDTMFLV